MSHRLNDRFWAIVRKREPSAEFELRDSFLELICSTAEFDYAVGTCAENETDPLELNSAGAKASLQTAAEPQNHIITLKSPPLIYHGVACLHVCVCVWTFAGAHFQC